MTAAKNGTALLYSLLAQAQQFPDTIVLGRGDVDLETPTHIVAAAREAMSRNGTEPTPPEGILALRKAIAERVRRINEIDVDPEHEIVVTNGGQEALFLMVQTAIGPGDELLVPEPNYNTYIDALRFAQGNKRAVPTYAAENFRVVPDRVRQAITAKTRALLLASPNNPSASVINPADARELVAIAQEHDLIILADDIYDMFLYDDIVHQSPASLPGGKERTLTLNALSKSFAMTGWRLGWIVGPADLMAQVKKLKAAVSGSTSIISQYAAIAALEGPQDVVDEMREIYLRRRRVVTDALDEMDIPYGTPQGGQFLFADISSLGLSCIDIAQRILSEQRVLVYPGIAFGPELDQYLRITFLQPEELLREGMARMKQTMSAILAAR